MGAVAWMKNSSFSLGAKTGWMMPVSWMTLGPTLPSKPMEPCGPAIEPAGQPAGPCVSSVACSQTGKPAELPLTPAGRCTASWVSGATLASYSLPLKLSSLVQTVPSPSPLGAKLGLKITVAAPALAASSRQQAPVTVSSRADNRSCHRYDRVGDELVGMAGGGLLVCLLVARSHVSGAWPKSWRTWANGPDSPDD